MKDLEDIYTESVLYPKVVLSKEKSWDNLVQYLADLYFNLPYASDDMRSAAIEIQNEIEPAVELLDSFSKTPKLDVRGLPIKERVSKIQGLFNAIPLSIIKLSDMLLDEKEYSKLDILHKINSILYTPAISFDKIFFQKLR